MEEKGDVSSRERLCFAKWVLRGIFGFSLLSVGIWLYKGSDILVDICRTGLLPIAALVIGDYFRNR